MTFREQNCSDVPRPATNPHFPPRLAGGMCGVRAIPRPVLRSTAGDCESSSGKGLRFLQPRILLVSLFLILSCFQAASAAGRPNIVFIYTDDQAPYAVEAAGDDRFITPNIDRIFDEGAHFTNSFVTTPVCSPSRVGLIASRYGTEMGITDWINPRKEEDLGLDPATVTWPELLADAGYHNGLFGKWHLGTQDRYHPTRQGYHAFMGIRDGGCRPKDPTLELLDGRVTKVEGYTCDIFTDHALQFIRDNRQGPFLVSLHFRAPHAAWLPVRPEDWAPFKDLDPEIPNPNYPNLDVAEVKRRTREYLASVKSVDRNVGRMLELLEELKLADDTIVIFTSDHGYNLGEHGVWYKGNAVRILTQNPPRKWENIPPNRRPNLWDTSLRVPTAVRWPGVVEPGSKVTHTVSNLDWFPTLVAMAGLQLPDDITIHGRSITPLLRGEAVDWDDHLYAEYSMHHGATTHMRAYRTPRWKYMRDFAHEGREELYDLTNDPGETNNLVDSKNPEHLRIKAELNRKILERMQELGDAVRPD